MSKYYVVKKDNTYFELVDDNQFYHFIKRNTLHVIGHNWNDTYRFPTIFDMGELYPIDYIVFDTSWRIVSTDVLLETYESIAASIEKRRPYRSRYYWSRYEKNYLGFRNGPVPRTGKGGWHYGSFYRKPKTHHERKWACGYEEYVRKARNKTNLPTSWDDVPRSDSDIKYSWKKNRKVRKQWMK